MTDENKIADALGIDTDHDIRIVDGVVTEDHPILPGSDTGYRLSQEGEISRQTILGQDPTGVRLDRDTGKIYERENAFSWTDTGQAIDPKTGLMPGAGDRRLNVNTGETETSGAFGYWNRFTNSDPRVGREGRGPIRVRPEEEPSEFDKALKFGFIVTAFALVIAAIIFAVLFVLVTSPIWGGMLAVSFLTVSMLVKRLVHPTDAASGISWHGVNARYPVRKSGLVFGVAFAAVIATLMLYGADGTSIAMVGGAILLGLIVTWKTIDRFGSWSVENAIKSPRTPLESDFEFLRRVTDARNVAIGASTAALLVAAAFSLRTTAAPNTVASNVSQPPVSGTYNPPQAATTTEINNSTPSQKPPASPEPASNETPMPTAPSAIPPADIRAFAAEGDSPAFNLVSTTLEGGRKLWIPQGWALAEETLNNGVKSYRWSRDDAFIRVDISPSPGDPLKTMQAEEERFQNSARYYYQRKRLRTGSDAYLGGLVWNFTLRRDEGKMMKRTIAYVQHGGKAVAVSTGSPEDQAGYGRLFTEVLNSLNQW